MDRRTGQRSCKDKGVPKLEFGNERGNSRVVRFAVVMGALAMLALFPAESEAVLMLKPGTQLPGQEYLDFGQQFLGRTVWIKGLRSNGDVTYFTGLRISGTRVLTFNPQTHSASGPITVLEVGNGANFLSSPGDIRQVSGVVLHPSLDASMLELTGDPFPGINFQLGDEPSFREKVSIAGFGMIALEDGPLLPQDGGLRGYEMVMGLNNSTNLSSNTFSLVNLPGGAKTGDSGSPLFNPATGAPFGITLRASTATSRNQILDYLPFNEQGLADFIAANSQLPEPTATLLAALGGAALISRRSRKVERPKPR